MSPCRVAVAFASWFSSTLLSSTKRQGGVDEAQIGSVQRGQGKICRATVRARVVAHTTEKI
eukprot:1478012-Pleurochrysis_carterae.AAC.1